MTTTCDIDERLGDLAPARTLQTGYRGGAHAHTLADIRDTRGIGIWVADDLYWAKGYAERSASRKGGKPVIHEISYVLNNPTEVDDLECSADDESFQELSGGVKAYFVLLCELRRAAGWDGTEMNEPCMFEVTNTPEFVALAKSLGFDGMIGWENGNECRVVSIFDKASIVSVKDVTSEISEDWWGRPM